MIMQRDISPKSLGENVRVKRELSFQRHLDQVARRTLMAARLLIEKEYSVLEVEVRKR